MLLESIATETDINAVDFIKDPYHLRNMMIFMNK
jgi:hypothetical protein